MCVRSNPERGPVWLDSVNNRKAQFRQETSSAMLMNFDIFLKYKNASSLRQGLCLRKSQSRCRGKYKVKTKKLGCSHKHSTLTTVILRKGLIFMKMTIFMTMTLDNFYKILNHYVWIFTTLVPKHLYF